MEALLAGGASACFVNPTLGRTPLLWAAQEGHEAVVALLLKHGADPDAASAKSGATPLVLAAYFGHARVVHMLLAAGAQRDRAAKNGATAAACASARGHMGIVALLRRYAGHGCVSTEGEAVRLI